jgi:hypothetical protein
MKKEFSLKASWQWTYSQLFSRSFHSINNKTCSIPARWHCEHQRAFLCLLGLLCWHELPATLKFFLQNFTSFSLSGFSIPCPLLLGPVYESWEKGNTGHDANKGQDVLLAMCEKCVKLRTSFYARMTGVTPKPHSRSIQSEISVLSNIIFTKMAFRLIY